MSIYFSWQHAIQKAKAEPLTKLICYTIATHMANDGSGCFPSYQQIADECGLSRRAVIMHVANAIAVGLLERDGRIRDNGSQSSNLYLPRMPEGGGAPDALGSECGALGASAPDAPRITTSPSLTAHLTPPVVPRDVRFEEFWQAYPHKVGKPKAQISWRSNKLDECADAILAGVENWKQSQQWRRDQGKFIPHPTTFLNQRRWEDSPQPERPPTMFEGVEPAF